MLLEKIVDSIINRLEGFLPSDDTRLDREYIEDRVHIARAQLILEMEANNEPIASDFYQKKCCLEVKCENTICNGIKLENVFYVTIGDISPARFAISYLGTVDFDNNFQMVSNTGFIHNRHSQLASKGTYYTIIGDKAYIRNLPDPDIQFLCITAVYDDPTDGACADDALTMDYPIPYGQMEDVESMVIEQIMPSMLIMPDNANDASEDQRTNKLNPYIYPMRRNRKRRR